MLRWLAILLVGFAWRAGAQDPLRTLPKNYWVEFENPWVRVIHVRYLPHEIVPLHDHPGPPTLFVYLSNAGVVRFLHGESNVVDGERPPVRVGQMRLNPGKKETHRVQNISDQQSDFLRVEFPTVPLALPDFDKRIPVADEAFWSMERPEQVVFDDAHLRLTRIGVAPEMHLAFPAQAGGRTLWLAVAAEGAIVNGKEAHAGEAWDTPALEVRSGAIQVELVRVEVK